MTLVAWDVCVCAGIAFRFDEIPYLQMDIAPSATDNNGNTYAIIIVKIVLI